MTATAMVTALATAWATPKAMDQATTMVLMEVSASVEVTASD